MKRWLKILFQLCSGRQVAIGLLVALFTPSLVGFLGATIAVTLAMSLAHTMEAFVSTLTGRAGPAARAWATEVLTVPLANVASAALVQLSALGDFIADEEEVIEVLGYYYVNNQTYYYTSNFSRSCPPARPCSRSGEVPCAATGGDFDHRHCLQPLAHVCRMIGMVGLGGAFRCGMALYNSPYTSPGAPSSTV